MPGRDVAGTVEQVGSAVTRFAVGDEVYGMVARLVRRVRRGQGGQARPQAGHLSFAQAAVVPISGGTALQALVDAGACRPGQSVLVIGASGGVGTYAVQLAKAFGAEVTGVCSTAKLDLVASLGADRVLDYTPRRLRRRHAAGTT